MGEFFHTSIAPKKRPRCPSLLTRALAVIGAILLLERTLSYSVYRNYHGAYNQRSGSLNDQVGELVTQPSSHAGTGATAGQSKAIIVASVSTADTSWIHDNFPDWERKVYVADDRKADLTVMKKDGREAAVYLTYIINNYFHLPDYMVFLHSRRYQWHNDDPMYDGVPPLKMLRLQRVKEEGYVSLRCTWYPGCPVGATPNLTAKEDAFGTRRDFARAYKRFFPDTTIPTEVGAPCCSQFAISREQVHKRPVQDYEQYRQWLWTSGVPSGKSGRVMEYMWHMIFGKPAKHCPTAAECYCKTYGLCHLKCPDKKKCLGRWQLVPWNARMPAKWPKEGLGEDGFPEDRWWEKFYPPSEWDGWEPKKKGKVTAKAGAG